MKRKVLIVCSLVIGLPLCGVAADGWYKTWNSAEAAAKKRSRPMIAMFVKNGCPQCEAMLKNTKSAKVRSALKSAVKAMLEVDENPDLTSQFSVSATPTLLLFTPDAGYQDYVYREEGAMSESSLVTLGETVNSLCETPAAKKKSSKSGKTKSESGVENGSTHGSPGKTSTDNTSAHEDANGATGHGTSGQTYYYSW